MLYYTVWYFVQCLNFKNFNSRGYSNSYSSMLHVPTCIFLFFEMLGTSCWLLSLLVKNIMVSVYVHVWRDLLFFNVGVQLWPGQVCFVLHFLEFPFHTVGSSLYRRESDKEGLLWTRKSTEKQIYLLIFNLCEPQNM